MPAAIGLKLRQEIIQRREAGETFAAIARRLEISYGTVRNIWWRYQQSGRLTPNYAACVRTGIRKDEAVYERMIALKRAYPTWGAGLIWVELADEFGEDELPCERTLQRWFHRAGLVERSVKKRVRDMQVQRGRAVHAVWALDAKEQVLLADGSYASWVALTDEGSGAMLEARAFPPEEVECGRTAGGEAVVANCLRDMGKTAAHPGR
jgi:putative transposase